jgi:hypothetical protein
MAQNYKKITLTVNPSIIDSLAKLAEKKGISKSAVARLLLLDGCIFLKKQWEVE